MPDRVVRTPIYVVSGGAGASGELLLGTLLAQFSREHADVSVFPYMQNQAQIEDVAARAATEQALVVHTMVDRDLRQILIGELDRNHVPQVDLASDLLAQLAVHLGSQPLGQPGRYRALRNDYFRRIAAIEFAVKHDDGQSIADIADADIVLLGVSRVGKTPVSVYLSLQGWRTANYPLVPNVPLPREIVGMNPSRIVGLSVAPAQLVRLRQTRQQKLGVSGGNYLDLAHVIEEVRAAHHLFNQHGFHTIDVTDKPIEAISEEVVAAVVRRPT